jgi:NADPH-dependent curcumin reductase CurA
VNRRILLAGRPQGAPVPQDFRTEQSPVPQPGPGEFLLRTLYLSLDPYMRGRMSEGASYVEPLALGDTMCGQTVCRVEKSNHPGFTVGDLVLANTGWQDYALTAGADVTKIDSGLKNPSYALGVLGMPGLTAYVGLLDIGQPKAGDTLVVAAATGAVGAIVGQIAKLKGCRVVGIAGGREKCEFAVKTLGFDACLDHYEGDLAQRLAQACPKGIDIYYENVGGAVFDAVLPLLNPGARMTICGLIAHYGDAPGADARAQERSRAEARDVRVLLTHDRPRPDDGVGDRVATLDGAARNRHGGRARGVPARAGAAARPAAARGEAEKPGHADEGEHASHVR